MKKLFTINNSDIVDNEDGSLTWMSGMQIDDDGSGPSYGDPDYQNDTSLHREGKALDATKECYIVVPPQVIKAVKGVVLGCKALVENTKNSKKTDAVVGDVGPHSKIGEASIATAKAVDVPNSPTEGGIDEHIIRYTIWPGISAEVNGIKYELKSSY